MRGPLPRPGRCPLPMKKSQRLAPAWRWRSGCLRNDQLVAALPSDHERLNPRAHRVVRVRVPHPTVCARRGADTALETPPLKSCAPSMVMFSGAVVVPAFGAKNNVMWVAPVLNRAPVRVSNRRAVKYSPMVAPPLWTMPASCCVIPAESATLNRLAT